MIINKRLKKKISFIGVGFQSQIAHLVNFSKIPNIELFDIAENDAELAEKVKNFFSFKGKIFKSIDEVINNKPDAIAIIVQRPLIVDLVKKCLKKNIPVFSEKPHVFSLEDYNKIKKIQKTTIWLKGYNRRHAKAVSDLKKNFNSYSKNLGKLFEIVCYCDSGNSWLGNKHFADPVIRKLLLGKTNDYPEFLPISQYKNYEKYLNAGSHFLDLLEFFDISLNGKIKSFVDDYVFKSLFYSNFNKYKPLTTIEISTHVHSDWNEQMSFIFESGKINLNFKSPMYRGGSCDIEIIDGNKKIIKIFRNDWHYENQANFFVDCLYNKKLFKDHGKMSISLYEKMWQSYIY
jgi:predicted dehydrogenase